MGTATNPNNFGYSGLFAIHYFSAVLYLSIIPHLSDAQNIVSFPAATTVNPTDSANIVDEQEYTLKMTGATTTMDNQTICTGFTLPSSPSKFWIIGFQGTASVSVVHHMTLYGCDTVPTKACGCGMPSRSPLYSWVRNTPKVRYTGTGSGKAGGFRIGGTSDKQYLFLEIHYCHANTANDQSGITIRTTTTGDSLYDLAIFPIMGLGTITPGQSGYKMDTCTTSLPPALDGNLIPFGFQVHTHNLGRLVSAYYYQYDNQIFREVGQGNPLWPQAYVEVPPSNRFSQPGPYSSDYFITRCIYDSSGTTTATNTNGNISPNTPWHEMCIFNVLVYLQFQGAQFPTKNAFMKGTCSSLSDLDSQSSSTTLLTSIPPLDIAAAYGNITSGTYGPYGIGYEIRMGGETFSNTFN